MLARTPERHRFADIDDARVIVYLASGRVAESPT